MKKYIFLITLVTLILNMFSCSEDDIKQLNVTRENAETKSALIDTNGIRVNNDTIMPLEKSSTELNLIKLHKTRGQQMTSSEDDELGIDDILGIPVNISVVKNIYNNKYLKYNGGNEEVTLSKFDENDEDLRFIFHRMPLTGLYYITPYRLSDNKYLLCVGYYKKKPEEKILYVKTTTDSFCATWEISKGGSENSFVLRNSDLLEQGTGGWMDVYSLALYVKDNNLRFIKYSGQPEQEFIIHPCEAFRVKSLTIDQNSSTISTAPSFVVEKDYYNYSNSQQTFTTTITQKATKTSSFNRKTNVQTTISSDVKVGAFFAKGSISVSVSNNDEWTYGKSEELEDTRDYNFPLIVAPYKHIHATLTVNREKAIMNYTAVLVGVDSGATITEHGTWENVDCTTINVVLQETTLEGNVTATRTLYGIPSYAIGVR